MYFKLMLLFFWVFVSSNLVLAKSSQGVENIKLAYDVSLAKEGFVSPVLKGNVGSKMTGNFLIDTGATSNVLASWYAQGLSKDKKSVMEVSDSTGHKIKVVLVKSDFKTGAKIIKDLTFLVAGLPPDFEKNKVAGLLAPKSLSSVVVVDFKMPQLLMGDSIECMQKNSKIELIPRKQQTACVAPSSSLFAVDVTIQQQTAKLLVDSGAETTKVFLGSKIGQSLKAIAQKTEKQTSGLSGNKVDLFELPKGPILFADYQTTSSVLIQDAHGKGCPSDGLLGMDLLKNCILLMAKEDIGLNCK